jgi:two-component system, LuxR family, response regulator FixJ
MQTGGALMDTHSAESSEPPRRTESVGRATGERVRSHRQCGDSLFLVDRDNDSRDKVAAALRSLGWTVHIFATLANYLDYFDPSAPGCVILMDFVDAESHRQLQDRRRKGSSLLPVIYVPNDFAVESIVDVFKVFAFVPERAASIHDPSEPASTVPASKTDRPFNAESPFPTDDFLRETSSVEREILALVCAGRSNKQLRRETGLSLRTLQRIKSSLYQRLRIDSPADIVRINDRLAKLFRPR